MAAATVVGSKAPLNPGPGAPPSHIATEVPQLSALLNQEPDLPIYTPSHPVFNSLLGGWNLTLVRRPLAIVRPLTEAHVAAAVRAFGAANIPFTIRSGGHDVYGRTYTSDGVVLDMRSLHHVHVEPDKTSARVGGGIVGVQLLGELESHGLFTPVAWVGTVGYVGWACGGGYGFYGARYGQGVDQILGARVALADGRIVDTDDGRDESLLWALRGAGCGSFGVVVELRVRVYPLPRMLAGDLFFPLSDLPAVVDAFETLEERRDGTTAFPDAFSGDLMTANHPDLGPAVGVLFAWLGDDKGDLSEAYAGVEKLSKVGKLLVNTVKEITPCKLCDGFEKNCPPKNYYFGSRTMAGFGPEVNQILMDNPPPQGSFLLVHNVHGKGAVAAGSAGVAGDLNDAADNQRWDGAFGGRSTSLVLGFVGMGPDYQAEAPPADMTAEAEWVERMRKKLRESGKSLEREYGNFIDDHEIDADLFYGRDIAARLREVKKEYDPHDVFSKGWPKLA